MHRLDDIGILKDLEADGEAPPWQKASRKAKQKSVERGQDDKAKFENAVATCNMGQPPTIKELAQWYSSDGKEVTERTVRNWAKKFGFFIDKNTGKVEKAAQDKMT